MISHRESPDIAGQVLTGEVTVGRSFGAPRALSFKLAGMAGLEEMEDDRLHRYLSALGDYLFAAEHPIEEATALLSMVGINVSDLEREHQSEIDQHDRPAAQPLGQITSSENEDNFSATSNHKVGSTDDVERLINAQLALFQSSLSQLENTLVSLAMDHTHVSWLIAFIGNPDNRGLVSMLPMLNHQLSLLRELNTVVNPGLTSLSSQQNLTNDLLPQFSKAELIDVVEGGFARSLLSDLQNPTGNDIRDIIHEAMADVLTDQLPFIFAGVPARIEESNNVQEDI